MTTYADRLSEQGIGGAVIVAFNYLTGRGEDTILAAAKEFGGDSLSATNKALLLKNTRCPTSGPSIPWNGFAGIIALGFSDAGQASDFSQKVLAPAQAEGNGELLAMVLARKASHAVYSFRSGMDC